MRILYRISRLGVLTPILSILCAGAERFHDASLSTDVNVVLVPVTVTDHYGATVTGLNQRNFTVLEDSIERPIVFFFAQDAPASVGLLLDISASMRNSLSIAKHTIASFLRCSNPEDDYFLLTVSSRPEVHSGFTGDLDLIEKAVSSTSSGGNTAFIDTVYLALSRIRAARNPRRALFIVSDGFDNQSRYTKAELMRIAMEADVQIYTIAVDTIRRSGKAIELVRKHDGLFLMNELAIKTGGSCAVVRNHSDAVAAANKAALALRNQYVIGYRPQNDSPSGKYHKIRVKVNPPNATVYARNGYYSR